MICPCINCPVLVICRLKVLKFLEDKEANNERKAIIKFVFDNARDREYGRTSDCSLLDKFVKMRIEINPVSGTTTYGIKTKIIEEVAKALGFNVNIKLGKKNESMP